MQHSTTDYLFILGIYTQPISLCKLLFHLEAESEPRRTAYLRAKADLQELAQKGLVELSMQNGACHVRLTPRGREVSDKTAAMMAENMVAGWHYQVMQFRPTCNQPA